MTCCAWGDTAGAGCDEGTPESWGQCQLRGTEGQNPPSPPPLRRLEGSLWSAPQLGKERVPECAKSLTPGPRHEVQETPDSRHPLRPGEGTGSGGQSVREDLDPVRPVMGAVCLPGGVRAAGAATLLCCCAFCRALRAASEASQMSSLFSQNGRTLQVGGTLALCAGAGLQLGLLKLVQPLRLLPQLCLVASEQHGNPMQRCVASGKP